MKKLILTCAVIFTFQTLVFSQVIPEIILPDDTVLYEKLYLHIDRELYSPGDDIWFKSYLVSGITNQLIPGFKNVYVQLIAEDGRIIDQRLMLSFNGVSNNDFQLPSTLPKGQYTIRGYTKYLQNFGEESLFHQKITVSGATDLPDIEDKPEEQQMIDVSFLPEGGSLVMNATNYIAFKAINEKGKGIPVTGKIVDETGKDIVTFESIYKGMGTFVMMPQEGKKYFARINGYPGFAYQFKEAKTDGIALHYRREENNLLFILSRNIKSVNPKNLVLAVSHGSEELFREEVEMTGFQYPVEIYKGFFPPGISKITLFDAQNNVQAERLVFVRNSDEKTLRITSDKTKYQPREKVELNIESLLNPEEDSIQGGLSVAVVNEDYFSGEGRNQTIESYLLLDSELKGPLESPASYFVEEENISVDEKLDLVMMVNGWRKYYWDELKDYFRKQLPGWADVGLTLKGEVKTLWGEKTVERGTVELGPFSSQFLILRDTTDEQGRFSFNRLYLKDSAHIMINAKSKNDKNNNVDIYFESTPIFGSTLSGEEIEEINKSARTIETTQQFNRSTYYRYLAEREFNLAEGSILLKEVEVKAELKTPPHITGFFGFPTRSYTLTDADRENYFNVERYLEYEVAGILDHGDGIRIGFSKGFPQIFVDGYAPAEALDFMSLDDIVKIEIIPDIWRHCPLNPTGGGGVISILTKTGFAGKFDNEFERIIHGRITPHVRGFRQAREFYSPKYSLENINNEKPDYRPTLYWSPDAIVKEGKDNIEFFTCDNLSNYIVIVEGISKNGKICFGTGLFTVSALQE